MGNNVSRNMALGAGSAAAVGAALLYSEVSKGFTTPTLEKIPSGGEQIASVLKEHGVKRLFVLAGGHVAPVYVESERLGIQVVDVRHEANAVFAADATGRLEGLGVAVVTAGPGVTNTVTAVKNAQMAESPVVILGGCTSTILMGRGSLQDIDHLSVMKSITKWQASPRTVAELVPTITEAIRQARTGVPGPVFVELPMDLLWPNSLIIEQMTSMMPSEKNQTFGAKALRWYLTRHLNTIFKDGDKNKAVAPPPVEIPDPSPADIKTTLAVLRKSQRPLIIIGSQAMCRPWEVDAIAEAVKTLGVPVYCAGMARGLLQDAGFDQLMFKHNRSQAIKEADVCILAGAVCDFRLQYGQVFGPRCTLINVNLSYKNATMNRSPTHAIVCDSGRFLQKLAEASNAGSSSWAEWKYKLQGREQDREKDISEKARPVPEKFCNPVAVLKEVSEQLAPNSQLIVDGGDFVGTAAYTLKPRKALSWLDPGAFGTLGVGAGFALGAKLARPDTETWIIYGDGALGFTIAEFDTFARFKIGLIAVVGNDAVWAQMIRDQERILGTATACHLARTEYHKVVDGFGGKGFLVETLDQLPGVLRQAKELAKEGVPVLVNCLIARSSFREGSISV
eukprot:Clim_evm108s157 gene=Clim_evmTU108s157